MEHCKHRVMDKCKKSGFPCTFSENCFEPEEPLVKTNANRLRAMTDEELAAFIVDKSPGMFSCNGRCLHWLRQPAKED